MSNSVLVDTNVLIYAVDADSQFHERALGLILDTSLQLFTTSKNVSEFLVVLTKIDEITLSINQCLDLLNSLLENIHVLYPTSLTFTIFFDLLRKYNPRGLWIHDLEIASIGLTYGISTIATHNKADFQRIEEIKLLEI